LDQRDNTRQTRSILFNLISGREWMEYLFHLAEFMRETSLTPLLPTDLWQQ
jgi:hypothetical protein